MTAIRPPEHQHGFSLLEVLIALLVLAVGILGVAGLQGSSLRNTYSAHLRSQATSIAQDMMERLRANRSYVFAAEDNYRVALEDAPTGEAANCATASCTDAELAAYDKDQWLEAIQALPDGKGSIDIDTATRSATILVMWNNERIDNPGTNCDVDITCMEFTIKP